MLVSTFSSWDKVLRILANDRPIRKKLLIQKKKKRKIKLLTSLKKMYALA